MLFLKRLPRKPASVTSTSPIAVIFVVDQRLGTFPILKFLWRLLTSDLRNLPCIPRRSSVEQRILTAGQSWWRPIFHRPFLSPWILYLGSSIQYRKRGCLSSPNFYLVEEKLYFNHKRFYLHCLKIRMLPLVIMRTKLIHKLWTRRKLEWRNTNWILIWNSIPKETRLQLIKLGEKASTKNKIYFHIGKYFPNPISVNRSWILLLLYLGFWIFSFFAT